MTTVRTLQVFTDFDAIDQTIDDDGSLHRKSEYDCDDYWNDYVKDHWVDITEPIVDRVPTVEESAEDIVDEIVGMMRTIQWYRHHGKNRI